MKKIITLIFLLTTISLFAQKFPPGTTLSIIPYSTPDFFPDYLDTIRDLTFGSQIMRITDQDLFNTKSANLRHNYSKDQPWNADESLIKLSGYPAAILNAKNYKFLFWLSPPDGEFFWSNKDPSLLFGIDKKSFVSQNVNTQQLKVIKNFLNVDEVLMGRYEGNFSTDDRYFPFLLKTGNQYRIETYDLVTNEVIGSMNVGRNGPDWVSFSQSGEYVVVQWSDAGGDAFEGVDVYDKNLKFLGRLTNETGHGDIGYDMNGNEVFVYYSSNNNEGSIVSVDLKTRMKTVQFSELPGLWGGHISCRNIDRPGYAYISEQGPPSDEDAFQGYREIFALKLDGSNTVERFCLHHSESNIGYLYQPHAVPNRDGSKVIFASNWTNEDIDMAHAFVTSYNNLLDGTTSIEAPTASLIEVYPNPFDQLLELKQLPTAYHLRIITMQGQLLYTYTGQENNHRIDLNHLASGLYFALITDRQNNLILAEKIVKK